MTITLTAGDYNVPGCQDKYNKEKLWFGKRSIRQSFFFGKDPPLKSSLPSKVKRKVFQCIKVRLSDRCL